MTAEAAQPTHTFELMPKERVVSLRPACCSSPESEAAEGQERGLAPGITGPQRRLEGDQGRCAGCLRRALARLSPSVTHRIPAPPPVPTIGAGQATCKKPSAFRGTSGHSGSGRGTLALPAMAVPSSIDTGTPAPPDLLPLDPVSTHRNGTSLCRNPARDLIFITRGRHRRDNGLTSNYKVCRRRRPRPQLTP